MFFRLCACHVRSGVIDVRFWIYWNVDEGGLLVVAGRTAVQYVNAGTSQLCSWSHIHLKCCQLHENSGCLFVLGFGTRKIFSKYGSSQYVLPLGHTVPPLFSFWHYRHVFGLFTDWLRRHWTHNNLEHERTWIERNIRVGPLVLLDASPFRTMVWN
jgi:hypothetical protein